MRNGRLQLAAHDALGVVLGLEVRMVEVFGLLEHVFAKRAVVEPRGGDRAHVMETSRLDRLGKPHRVLRSVDVGDLLLLGARLEVVDRGEVEQVVDLALELPEVGRGHAETGLGEIALDADDLLVVRAPALAHRRELLLRALAHQHVDRLAAPQQVFDEVPADEAGCAGDEIGHLESPCGRGVDKPCRRVPEAGCRRGAPGSTDGDCNSLPPVGPQPDRGGAAS